MILAHGFSILAVHMTYLEIFEKERLPRLHLRLTESDSLRLFLDSNIFKSSPDNSNVQLRVRTVRAGQKKKSNFYHLKLIFVIATLLTK